MTIKPGAFRFNTDSMKLEIFRGSANYSGTASMAGIGTLAAGQWEEIQATSPEVQTGGTRGVMVGGFDQPTVDSFIDYINVSTTGNAIDFGTTYQIQQPFAFSSRTRGIIAGGGPGPTNNSTSQISDIKFITIASTGNITTFGDIGRDTASNAGGNSNETRGLICGGKGDDAFSPVNTIDYITISSTGNGQDFGDIQSGANRIQQADFGNSTRAIFAGGYYITGSDSGSSKTIEYVHYSTQGNTAYFGDCTQSQNIRMGGASNSIRGVFGGGQPRTGNSIDTITIPTLGDAIDFGDLTTSNRTYLNAVSSPTRCVFMGGSDTGSTYSGQNVIDYVQFASKGDAVDFGDLTHGRARLGSFSNGHGGL